MIKCSEAVDFLKSFEDSSVGCVVTSPPYNIGVDYDTYVDSRVDYNAWMVNWITEALRISESGIMLNIGAKASSRTQFYILMGAIAAVADIQNTIIWAKSVHVVNKTYGHFKPINSNAYANNTFEYVFHLTTKGRKVNIDKLSVGVPFEDKSNLLRFKSNSKDTRCRGSVWFVPYKTRNTKLSHPATYPIELAEMMIKFSGTDGIIVDPFMGSGTTAVAAINCGLKYAGCDISANYAYAASLRIINHTSFSQE